MGASLWGRLGWSCCRAAVSLPCHCVTVVLHPEPPAIIAACTAYLDYAMRLMATEAVLVCWSCCGVALEQRVTVGVADQVGAAVAAPRVTQDVAAEESKGEPVHGNVAFTWSSVLDNRARVSLA